MSQTIVEWFGSLLLTVYPSPVFWGLATLVVFSTYLFLKRLPNSVISHLVFILILGLSGVIGGVFIILENVLFAIAGGVFVLGLWQFVGRR